MHNRTIAEQKTHFITQAEREICDTVRPILERRVEEYKEYFGGFDTIDQWLWHNVNIGIEVATVACYAVDEEED